MSGPSESQYPNQKLSAPEQARTQDEPSVEQLIAGAASAKTDRERWRYLLPLGEMLNPAAVPIMIESLGAESGALQALAAQFLGSIGDKRAINPLIQKVEDANPRCSRIWFIEALGKLGAVSAVEALVHVLHTTESIPERYTAIEALGRLGDQSVLADIERYATDPNHHVTDRVKIAKTKLMGSGKA